jgi:hypothetical protein
MFPQQLPQTPKPSRQNVASKPSAPSSCVPTIHKFTFPQPKSQATGIVTYFKSHSHFFFRVEFPTFDLLEKRLHNKYSKIPFQKIPLKGNKSAYAACLHNRWHRAEFLSTVTGSTAKVLLVDNGRHHDVPLTNLRLLDKEDAEVPVKTVCCALRGVMLGERNDMNGPIEEVMGKIIEARFVSIISENKYSTILTKGIFLMLILTHI